MTPFQLAGSMSTDLEYNFHSCFSLSDEVASSPSPSLSSEEPQGGVSAVGDGWILKRGDGCTVERRMGSVQEEVLRRRRMRRRSLAANDVVGQRGDIRRRSAQRTPLDPAGV